MKKQFSKIAGASLLVACLVLLLPGCSLEETVEPFTGADGCLITSASFFSVNPPEENIEGSESKLISKPAIGTDETNDHLLRIESTKD